MKAEHRKELQTNALADRMGRFIQRMKTRPSRGSVLTVFLILLVVAAIIFFFWVRGRSGTRDAKRWVEFDRLRDSEEKWRELGSDYSQLPVGRASRFQLAWAYLWDGGIRDLMRSPFQASKNIQQAREWYAKLAEECKDDPVWGAEALYNQAVAEEALAAVSVDRLVPTEPFAPSPEKHLDAALELYKEVATTYKDSAHGKDAQKRADELADKEGARLRISDFYQGLSNQLRLRLQLDQIQQELQNRTKKGEK
ncbi:MAG: hypothetical protein L0Z62_50330 [Gemmataceae bacterium]|nr:hypothetical protein [Gemmataceae bacterium]